MKPYAAVVIFCLVAVNLFAQPSNTAVKNKSNPIEHAQASPQDGQKSATNSKTPNSGSPCWYASSEWWVVIIAALTGAAIAYQAREMTRATTVMKGQLTEMQSAGVQAGQQLQHIINSERAWIQVVVAKIQGLKPDLKDHDLVWIWPDIMNQGKTPARITKIVMRSHQVDKDDSPYPSPPRLPPEPEYPVDDPHVVSIEVDVLQFPNTGTNPYGVFVWGTDFTAIEAREKFLYVYGYVEYTDVGDNPRVTRFCEVYWVPVPGDLHSKGFVTSVVTPPAYTKCT